MALNGGKLDFTVTGQLPPSNRRKRQTREMKSKPSKTDFRRSISSRPKSVPASSQWDENNPLSIQSTPIPLSSRSKYSSNGTPLHSTRVQTPKSNSISRRTTYSSTNALVDNPSTKTKIKSNNIQTDRSHHYNTCSNTTTNPQSHYNQRYSDVCQSMSDIDLLLDCSIESIPEVLDESVNKLSTEVDSFLRDINSGLILGSSFEEPLINKQDRCVHVHVSSDGMKRTTNDFSSNQIMHIPSLPLTGFESNTLSVIGIEERAAITIQEWFRECRKNNLKKELERVDKYQKESVITAVVKIQRWFRTRHHQQQERKLKGLLQEKRKEMNKHRQEESRTTINTDEEKEQRRAMKMQAARKQAIEALKKKRDKEKIEKELIIQQEMAMLEETGVVKKSKSTGKVSGKSRPKVAANFTLKNDKCLPDTVQSHSKTIKLQSDTQQSDSNHNHESLPNERKTEKQIPITESESHSDLSTDKAKMTELSSSVESNAIDDFFKAGPRKTTPKRQPSPIPEAALSKQPSSTTMNDIFATLKELEEDHPPLPGGVDPMSPSSSSYLSKSNLDLLHHSTVATNNISDQKLQTILTYLDDIQKNERLSREEITKQKVSEVNVPTGIQEDLSQQLEAASAVANDVTTTIVTQRMELENKNKTIEMLQKALNQQRGLTVYHAKETEKESQKRLQLQKEEYEGAIGRHQCFIDQLIDDKKTLGDKCEELLKEVKEMDKKYKTKIATMENTHAAEIEKLKHTTMATEKMRREKWKTDETQRIKQATVKSLEPEIQRIIARGKAEIQKLKAIHEAELLQADERASRRFLQQTEELRGQSAQEKEIACQHERELARHKYEQLAEQEEQSYQQLRRKLYSEVQVEKDKLAVEANTKEEETMKELKEIKDSHQLELARLKLEHESNTAETQRRHTNELRDVKERVTIEKQAWEENYIRKQDAILLTKERELRERLRRERDMEIETVIQKLEAETATTRDECERTSESRVKRIREKYETELKEVEKSERKTLEKFNTMKAQLTEYEGDIIGLRSQLRHRDEEIERVNEIATRLTKERDRVADVVRKEFADRMVNLEDDNRHMKLEISELKSRHSLELSRKERGKERELEEVHQRVKEALAKKEDNYKMLRSQHEAALKRADHLEMLLEQQRKQLLKR